MRPDINERQVHRNATLFIELAGLLHDVGKLSEKFLDYRLNWQNDPNGWGSDPHDNQFLAKHEAEHLRELVRPIFQIRLESLLKQAGFEEGDFTIWKAVDEHTERKDVGHIMKLLQAADAVDSAIDRNNPLWGAEQQGEIYQSNVFGYEKNRKINIGGLESARKTLYQQLGALLPEYTDRTRGFTYDGREKVLTAIKRTFEQGVADTTRPQNDTTLWEHSYAVASILKALAAHYIMTKELLDGWQGKDFNLLNIQFRILGMGWDGLRFMSQGYKIGDLVGRKKVLEDIKGKARQVVEWHYALGNEVYADDDGIYFVVPKCIADGTELANTVIGNLITVAVGAAGGELQPYFSISDETFTMTSLGSVITDIRDKCRFPFDQSQIHHSSFIDSLNQVRDSGTRVVCSVCRLRPVRKREDKERICESCLDRRKNASVDDGSDDVKHTIFVDEIGDEHRRVAAVVARFNLADWLNGKMVRTMFVTEARGIDREIRQLRSVQEMRFQAGEQERRQYFDPVNNPPDYNYHKIHKDVGLFVSDNVDDQKDCFQKAILYDRRDKHDADLNDIRRRWQKFKQIALDEYGKTDDLEKIILPSILCGKTPTPSTILDVWDTTKEFLETVPKKLMEDGSVQRRRVLLTLDPPLGQEGAGGTIEAILVKENKEDRRCEVLPLGDGSVEVIGAAYSNESSSTWQGKLKIRDISYTITDVRPGRTYWPFRTITISPNLFIALVPAEKAVALASGIYNEYIERFGKAMGRLPFSIGTVFFDRPMPMFVVLDAAKRMIANFDDLSQSRNSRNLTIASTETEPNRTVNIRMITEGNQSIKWSLPRNLGNCAEDNHHCYSLLADDHSAERRKTYFRTIAGDVACFSELKSGDVIKVYPNYFDFIYLDSNARRYDLMLERVNRRSSSIAGTDALPVLLDELDQKIMRVWNIYLKGKGLRDVTDTKIRNLRSLWCVKKQEWGTDGRDQWKILVRDSLFKEFGLSPNDETFTLLKELKEMIESGLLFETLELYMGILKERIGE